MPDDLADRARRGRRSGAALKAQLATLRSAQGGARVFVFEGREDVGPFESWINRIDGELQYIPLAGKGKGQLLDLRRRLRDDRTGLERNTFFFVDRDFDWLRGQAPGADLFCTETYSIENGLVSRRTLRSVLLDELRLDQYRDEVVSIQLHFEELLEEFFRIMREPNWLMFWRSLHSDKKGSISESISGYVRIEWDQVKRAYTDGDLAKLIPLSGEPEATPEEIRRFENLDPPKHYRGKHVLAFFLSWLDALARALQAGETNFFQERIEMRFSRGMLTMRSLASRSEVPNGLEDFIGSMGS